MTDEEYQKSRCKHGPNQKCVHCLGVTKENFSNVKAQCNHAPNQKCPNCAQDEDKMQAKHKSFEHYLSELKSKCKGMHKPEQRCQNCTAVMSFSYKVKYDCVSHKPFPLGMCNKCIPPSVVLNRQTYRHVDYVSIMNF